MAADAGKVEKEALLNHLLQLERERRIKAERQVRWLIPFSVEMLQSGLAPRD